MLALKAYMTCIGVSCFRVWSEARLHHANFSCASER